MDKREWNVHCLEHVNLLVESVWDQIKRWEEKLTRWRWDDDEMRWRGQLNKGQESLYCVFRLCLYLREETCILTWCRMLWKRRRKSIKRVKERKRKARKCAHCVKRLPDTQLTSKRAKEENESWVSCCRCLSLRNSWTVHLPAHFSPPLFFSISLCRCSRNANARSNLTFTCWWCIYRPCLSFFPSLSLAASVSLATLCFTCHWYTNNLCLLLSFMLFAFRSLLFLSSFSLS